MKKRSVEVILVFSIIILLLTITLVSAGWWSDFNNWFRNLFGFHEKLEEGLNGELKSLGIDGTNDYGSPDYPRICEEGEKICELMPSRTANFRYSIKECKNSAWNITGYCEINQGCKEGKCTCIEGEKRCFEKPARRGGGIIKGVEECGSGERIEIERCQYGCENGACVEAKELGLVAYYKFDDGNRTIAEDSADAHDGTIYGATFTDGKSGTALKFDGKDDYVKLNASNSLITNSSSWTISSWFKADSITSNNNEKGNRIVTFHRGSTRTAVSLMVGSNNRAEVCYSNRAGSAGDTCSPLLSATISADTWYLLQLLMMEQKLGYTLIIILL